MRHLFAALAILSTLTLIAAFLAWQRTRVWRDTIVVAQDGELSIRYTEPGEVRSVHVSHWPIEEAKRRYVTSQGGDTVPDIIFSDQGDQASIEVDSQGRVRADPVAAGPFHMSEPLPASRGVSIRILDVVLFSAVIPAAWLVRWVRRLEFRKRRARLGLCPECGYDVRAYSDECPGCGYPIGG